MRDDELDDEKALMILFFLSIQESAKSISEIWDNFEKEIKYNNRFFPNSRILDEIERLKSQAEIIIPQGEMFYRARLMNSASPLGIDKKNEKEIIDIISKHYPELKGKDVDVIKYYLKNTEFLVTLNESLKREIYECFNKRKRFWGYNAKDSDAPPADKASAGRANSRYISYLYLSNDVKTAIYEVRPRFEQFVSVAKIRIDKDLKIYNFCNINAISTDDLFTLSMMSELFSDYKTGKEEDYYATQYICEYIKKLGYDGIRFISAVNPEGKNIVLFNTKENPDTSKKDYTILNSKVYNVSSIDIKYKQIAPLREGRDDR